MKRMICGAFSIGAVFLCSEAHAQHAPTFSPKVSIEALTNAFTNFVNTQNGVLKTPVVNGGKEMITPNFGDNSRSLANTQYVDRAVTALGSAASASYALKENGWLSNPNIRGGSAPGMDVSGALTNGILISKVIQSCSTSSPNIYYGAVNSSSQMGDPTNTQHLLASGNVLPYFNISGIAGTIYGAGGAISDVSGPIGVRGFQNILKTTGTSGIIELAYTHFMTPDIPSKYWQNIENPAGSQSIDDSTMLTQTGFKPAVALLNIRRDVDVGVVANDDEAYLTANDEHNFLRSISDIKKNIPTVKNVWPFILPNRSGHDFVTDDYWTTTRDTLQKAGGVGIDVPAGLYSLNRPGSVASIAEEIKWANSLGIKTVVLLSPYAEDTPAGYGRKVYPQWRYDSQFLTHVRNIVGWLQAAGAAPTAWSVVSYSPIQWYNPISGTLSGTVCKGCTRVIANLMGSDTDSVNQTVSYVARWVAENAPTSTYTNMPNMGQISQACAATVLSGYQSAKPVISTGQVGLGSLAYTDYDKADLKYPALEGAQVTDNINVLGPNTLAFGVGSTTAIPYLGWDGKNGGLSVWGAPFNIKGGYNLNLLGESSLAINGGNQSFAGTGTNGIQFQSKDGTRSTWITGDGNGGVNVGSSVYINNVGQISLGNVLQIRGNTKAAILAISNPQDGMLENDADDHIPLIYENGHWYPIQLGKALQ
ncbi:hypothetical protein JK202_02915 [Gluconobacter sp. Dm-62]|uniref:hypothetical protein n=1 Tax=Gluconobacter sp. Dm-62 TaxID=2799804 RepID=UPI001B8AC7FA|nr:hypothetical protein [Gluconobacter sp. Dm-62]MBS1101971.1 hypothetical protein [Gluconobacter sp. Dm-62]